MHLDPNLVFNLKYKDILANIQLTNCAQSL